MLRAHSRELAVAVTIVVLLLVLRLSAPGFFTSENFVDMLLANMPVMLIALGMTLIVLTGEIDISVGSIFAICSVVMGVSAKSSLHGISGLAAVAIGFACGALNGLLVGFVRVPSIVATLSMMVALRDGLRWKTQGSWIGDLPPGFQWFGLDQRTYAVLTFAVICLLIVLCILGLRFLRAGRAIFATGSNEAAARLAGIPTGRVIWATFALTGALAGLAAMLNAVRFHQIPSNTGIGMEMDVIAAVAIGGGVFTGGSGTVVGTVLGVILLAIVGPALTFLGLSAYWEKALQGAIILAALALNSAGSRSKKHAHQPAVASS
jgi:rhamnose transport system permease protein